MLYYDTVRMNVHTQLHDNGSSQSLHDGNNDVTDLRLYSKNGIIFA